MPKPSNSAPKPAPSSSAMPASPSHVMRRLERMWPSSSVPITSTSCAEHGLFVDHAAPGGPAAGMNSRHAAVNAAAVRTRYLGKDCQSRHAPIFIPIADVASKRPNLPPDGHLKPPHASGGFRRQQSVAVRSRCLRLLQPFLNATDEVRLGFDVGDSPNILHVLASLAARGTRERGVPDGEHSRSE